MKIRKFRDADARRTSYLIRRTLRVSNGPDYDTKTIDSFVAHFSPSTLRKLSRERDIFVVEDNGRLLATGSLAGRTVAAFFVNPRFQRQGVGTALLKHIERAAARGRVERLRVNSSFTALPFYRLHGYRRLPNQPKPGAPFIAMTKTL